MVGIYAKFDFCRIILKNCPSTGQILMKDGYFRKKSIHAARLAPRLSSNRSASLVSEVLTRIRKNFSIILLNLARGPYLVRIKTAILSVSSILIVLSVHQNIWQFYQTAIYNRLGTTALDQPWHLRFDTQQSIHWKCIWPTDIKGNVIAGHQSRMASWETDAGSGRSQQQRVARKRKKSTCPPYIRTGE